MHLGYTAGAQADGRDIEQTGRSFPAMPVASRIIPDLELAD